MMTSDYHAERDSLLTDGDKLDVLVKQFITFHRVVDVVRASLNHGESRDGLDNSMGELADAQQEAEEARKAITRALDDLRDPEEFRHERGLSSPEMTGRV